MSLRKGPLKKRELEPADTVEVANIGTMSVNTHIPIISDEPEQI